MVTYKIGLCGSKVDIFMNAILSSNIKKYYKNGKIKYIINNNKIMFISNYNNNNYNLIDFRIHIGKTSINDCYNGHNCNFIFDNANLYFCNHKKDKRLYNLPFFIINFNKSNQIEEMIKRIILNIYPKYIII